MPAAPKYAQKGYKQPASSKGVQGGYGTSKPRVGGAPGSKAASASANKGARPLSASTAAHYTTPSYNGDQRGTTKRLPDGSGARQAGTQHLSLPTQRVEPRMQAPPKPSQPARMQFTQPKAQQPLPTTRLALRPSQPARVEWAQKAATPHSMPAPATYAPSKQTRVQAVPQPPKYGNTVAQPTSTHAQADPKLSAQQRALGSQNNRFQASTTGSSERHRDPLRVKKGKGKGKQKEDPKEKYPDPFLDNPDFPDYNLADYTRRTVTTASTQPAVTQPATAPPQYVGNPYAAQQPGSVNPNQPWGTYPPGQPQPPAQYQAPPQGYQYQQGYGGYAVGQAGPAPPQQYPQQNAQQYAQQQPPQDPQQPYEIYVDTRQPRAPDRNTLQQLHANYPANPEWMAPGNEPYQASVFHPAEEFGAYMRRMANGRRRGANNLSTLECKQTWNRCNPHDPQ
ncbi:hypothetical protein LTR85_002772 [Meristemomyces frigidus]|nr:hypothetical protein LTR85_002772 [Meristemomyces frigidus]